MAVFWLHFLLVYPFCFQWSMYCFITSFYVIKGVLFESNKQIHKIEKQKNKQKQNKKKKKKQQKTKKTKKKTKKKQQQQNNNKSQVFWARLVRFG